MFIALGRDLKGQVAYQSLASDIRSLMHEEEQVECARQGREITRKRGDEQVGMLASERRRTKPTQKNFFPLVFYSQTRQGLSGLRVGSEGRRELEIWQWEQKNHQVSEGHCANYFRGRDWELMLLQRIWMGWRAGVSATFFHSHNPERLQEPKWVKSEQDISRDGPQKAWVRTLHPVLAQELHNGS